MHYCASVINALPAYKKKKQKQNTNAFRALGYQWKILFLAELRTELSLF